MFTIWEDLDGVTRSTVLTLQLRHWLTISRLLNKILAKMKPSIKDSRPT